MNDEPFAPVDSEVGIDLGLTTFAVLSDGKTIASLRFLRQAERRLRKAQQLLSRKEKGSANRAKARIKVAKAHAKVADTRKDWAHKQSTMIIRDNQAGATRGRTKRVGVRPCVPEGGCSPRASVQARPHVHMCRW
ncbi:transposase [Nocardia sp. NPDC052112]|uniref:RNA-guided endonuclease InsQ/TnpB family protein n=1 Tax=Nocardia sp. NPDC052112 TaxID=3155646 RepID=UPI003449DA4B